MFRFSLAALLLFVLLAALGCAALVNANELWRQTTTTTALLLLLGATLAAILWQGKRKSSAIGFAVFGWAYLALTFIAAFGLRNDLLTEKALSSLYRAVHGEEQPTNDWVKRMMALTPEGNLVVDGSNFVTVWDTTTGSTLAGGARPARPSYEDFADIGHILGALLVAGLGAVVARFLTSATARKASAPLAPPEVIASPGEYDYQKTIHAKP